VEFELGLGGSRVMRRIWVRVTVVAGDMGNVAEVAEDGVFYPFQTSMYQQK